MVTHSKAVAARARPADREEWLRATAHRESLQALINQCLLAGLQGSLGESYTILYNGEPVCMFGVNSMPEGYGGIWLIATEAGDEIAADIHRLFWKDVSSGWLVKFGALHAHVWTGNESHIEWLKRVGFVDEGRSPLIDDSEFRLYVLRPH